VIEEAATRDRAKEAPMELPPIVSEEEWQRSHEARLAKEKEATRAEDTPPGCPQGPPYRWWRLQNEYEQSPAEAS
jgi:predicted dithiol-disulfide oxidoreductase (DUF899 family)